MNDKVLRCSLCTKKFDKEDVKKYRYFVEISTCYNCCEDMSKKDFSFTCFGKPNKISDTGKVIGFGYDPVLSTDCSLHCRHKVICKLFATGELERLKEQVAIDESIPFKRNTVIGTAFRMCMKGTTDKKLHRFLEKETNNTERVVRILKSGANGRQKWLFKQVANIMKIYVRL